MDTCERQPRVDRETGAQPLVTVVIPVFNKAPFINSCIEQLDRQGLAPDQMHIVLVDDCSNDGSAALCDALADARSNIEVVHFETNRGAGVARNAGIDLARGEYLYFFDADDCIDDGALAWLCARMDDTLDVLFFSARLVYTEEGLEAVSPQDPDYFRRLTDPGVLPGKRMFIHQIANRDFCAQPCVQLSRTDYIRTCNARFAEGIVNEDNAFVLLSLLGNGTCAMTPRELYQYHIRPGSVTVDQSRGFERFRAHVVLSEMCRQRAYEAQREDAPELCDALCQLDDWFIECATAACLAMDKSVPFEPLCDSAPAVTIQRGLYRRLKEQADEKRLCQRRIAELERELDAVHACATWKAGRIVTAFPRKLKGLLTRLSR